MTATLKGRRHIVVVLSLIVSSCPRVIVVVVARDSRGTS
jgi:hypothetical protein